MSTEQHISPSAIVTKAGVGVDGPGYLAGEHPAGRTTVNGVPVAADVDVFYELDNKDWQCVASTTSQPDGTWSIVGLNPDKKFNVVARHASFGGVIAVDVQPSRTDVVTLSGAFTANDDFNGVAGFMTIESGMPPFTASVVDPLPYGLNPLVVDGRKLAIEGTSDDVGLWDSVVRVTASNGVWVDVPVQVRIQVPSDPHWDKVVALLHFDGDLTDETGRVWINSGVTTDNTNSLYNDYGVFSGSSKMTATIPALGTNDFTIEAWVNRDADTDYRCIFDSRASSPWNKNGLAIYTSSPLTGNVPVIWEGTQILKGSIKITESAWVHIAIVRESGIIYYYANGSLIGSGSFTSDLTDTTAVIGNTFQNVQAYQGRMDELRITKGVARYTKNFTPPVNPFPSR